MLFFQPLLILSLIMIMIIIIFVVVVFAYFSCYDQETLRDWFRNKDGRRKTGKPISINRQVAAAAHVSIGKWQANWTMIRPWILHDKQ